MANRQYAHSEVRMDIFRLWLCLRRMFRMKRTTEAVVKVLACNGQLERFLPELKEDCERIRATFAGLWGLESDEEETQTIVKVKKEAIEYPERFVLKPQLEGGGGNYYGSEVAEKLKEMSRDERAAHILMERIQPMRVERRCTIRSSLRWRSLCFKGITTLLSNQSASAVGILESCSCTKFWSSYSSLALLPLGVAILNMRPYENLSLGHTYRQAQLIFRFARQTVRMRINFYLNSFASKIKLLLRMGPFNYLVRPFEEVTLGEVVGELGIYGCLYAEPGFDSGRERVYKNVSHGHIIRSKAANVDKGGVAVGAAVIDSPFLF
uniref:glutathione synthase n=1 Tax=Parascaris equorum TaxID=6256 RepID=A0A914RZ70_PAREQ